MSMQALNSQTSQRRSSLLERYQPKTGSQDPMSTSASLDVHASPSITKSTSQRSLQHSSLLQRYQPKPLGSAGGVGGGSNVGAAPNAHLPNRSSSQRSLDQSKLLKRYYHQPNSLDENQPPAGGQDGARLGDALSANANDQQRYSSQRSLENSKLLQRYNPTVNNSQEFTGLSVRESTPVARFNRGTSLEPERVQRSSLLSKYTPRFGKSLDRNQALEAAKGYGAGYGSEQHLPHQPAPERPVQSLASSRTEIADYGADHFDYYRDIRSRSSSLSRGGLAGRKGVPSARGSQRKLPEPTEPVTQETLPMVSAVAEPVLGNIASALPLPMVSVVPPTPAPVQQQQQQQHPLDASSKSPFDGKTLSVTSNQSAGVQPAPAITGPPVKPIRKDLQSGGKGPVAPAAGATLGASGIPGAAGTTANINVTVHRAEVPLAREESFGTIPEPAPRRSRSRSQLGSKILSNDDDMDRVSRGAESLIGGIIDAAPGARGSYPYEVSENNGYATVRKEAPPRPPAPIRRRKSTRSLDAAPPLRQFNTLPSYNHSVSPVRPQRNYSTINPNRPPRRKSVSSLTGSQQQLKPTQKNRDDGGQYEDVLEGPVPPQRPPPPAIQRDVANKMKDRPLPPPPRPSRKPRRPDGTDRHDLDGGAERVVSVDAEEVDTSTQTDPVSEDFGLDAEIAAVTEQAAAAAAAAAATSNRLADTEQLEGALHRFRDGNTKALSDRPKSSRSGSRPETPASILIERKVSTPSLAHESVVEASLTVQPLEEFDDDQYIAELVKKYVSDEARKPEPRRTVDERRLRKSTSSLGREEEIRPVETLGTSLRTPTIRSTSRTSVDGRLSAATPEPLRNVEISPTVIEEIVERLRTTEQHHIDELHKLHQQQLEDLRQQHEAQKRLQEQRLEEQQRQLLEQQSQQLHETQQLKEQILQQQEHQKMLLAQQQNQQQQLLVAQQQQQLLMEQQEKERELQREKERELLREREQELERARERERELHLARELELQRAREVEQQRARDLEQQRIREMELQRAREQEHQRLRELEIQRAIEAEQGRQRELELQQRAAQAAASAAAAAATQVVAKETEAAAPRNETSNDAQQQPAVEEKQQQAAEVSVDVVDGVAIATATELPPAAATATGSAAPPVRPPLPTLPQYAFHPDYLAYGIPPAAASPYLLRPSSVPSEEDGMTPLAPQRRRRHLRSKRESTSEDDQHQQREQQQRRHRHSTRSPEPSIPSLGGQLVRACGNSLRQTGDDLMAMLRASSKDENKRDLHIAIIILIVIVAGLMALGMSGEKAVHHHHWDYFSPPGHGAA